MKPLRPLDLALVAAVALALRLAFAWAIPFDAGSRDPNCAPDEGAHLTFALALSTGRAPRWPSQTSSIYAVFVPVPYAAHAAAVAASRAAGTAGPAPRFPAVDAWARPYLVARLGSVLLGVATAVALALAAAVWTGARGAGVAAGLAAALYPQVAFVDAYVNSDAFTVCAGAALAWAVARWARRGEGEDGAAAVGLAAGVVLLGKPSGFFVLPPTAAWLCWAAWRVARGPRAVLRAGVATLAVAAPVLAWNALRNGGDVLGVRGYHRFLAQVWNGKDGRALPDAFGSFMRSLPPSTFGVFRNMNLPLPGRLLDAAAVLACVGVGAAAWRLRRAPPQDRRGAAFVAAVVASNLALVVYNCWFVDFSPQGRYLLVSALLLAATTAWAPAGLLPGRVRWLWPVGCVGFLAASSAVALRLVYLHPCLR